MDEIFPHHYRARIAIEIKTGMSVYYYPRPIRRYGSDGVIVEFVPESGKPWLGIFAFGSVVRNYGAKIYATPDPEKLFVVSNGAGYFVCPNNPDEWSRVDVELIVDVRTIPSHDILVVADYTNLTAFGKDGLVWRSGRLVLDGLKIVEVLSNYLLCECDDMGSEYVERFKVDLLTGVRFE